MNSNEKLCQLCYINQIDEQLKVDILCCKSCHDMQLQNFKQYKNDKIKKGLLFPSIDEIIPGKLYLGNEDAARDKQLMKDKGITHILIAGSHMDQLFPQDFKYMQLQIQDSVKENILDHIEGSVKFINEGQIVFVHCAAGVSRSASIVISYLMSENKWNFDKAYGFVKQKRPAIFPNLSFQEQLQQYEKQIIKDKNH